jgi:hypothetical protein
MKSSGTSARRASVSHAGSTYSRFIVSSKPTNAMIYTALSVPIVAKSVTSSILPTYLTEVPLSGSGTVVLAAVVLVALASVYLPRVGPTDRSSRCQERYRCSTRSTAQLRRESSLR